MRVTEPLDGSMVIGARRRQFAVRRHEWHGRYLRLVLHCELCGRRHLERQHMIRTRQELSVAAAMDFRQWCPTCRGPGGPVGPAGKLTPATRPN